MSKNAMIILIVVSALVFLGVGLVVGNALNKASADDPWALQSYVDSKVTAAVGPLQTKINDLEARVAVLEDRIEELTNGELPSHNPTEVRIKSTLNVNLRSAPDKNNSDNIVGSAKNGDKFEYLDTVKDSENVDWYKVKLEDGSAAYVISTYADLLY